MVMNDGTWHETNHHETIEVKNKTTLKSSSRNKKAYLICLFVMEILPGNVSLRGNIKLDTTFLGWIDIQSMSLFPSKISI